MGSDPDPVHRGRVGSPLIGGLVAPLGTVAYLGYVAVKERDPLAYLQVAGQWGNHFDGGISLARWIGHLLSGGKVLAAVLVTGVLAVLLLQVWWMLRDRYPLPVVVFTVLSVAVTLSMSGYFGSQPRHLLPVFPLLMPLAVWLGRAPTRRVRAVIAGLGLISAGYGPIWLFGPGPP